MLPYKRGGETEKFTLSRPGNTNQPFRNDKNKQWQYVKYESPWVITLDDNTNGNKQKQQQNNK